MNLRRARNTATPGNPYTLDDYNREASRLRTERIVGNDTRDVARFTVLLIAIVAVVVSVMRLTGVGGGS